MPTSEYDVSVGVGFFFPRLIAKNAPEFAASAFMPAGPVPLEPPDPGMLVVPPAGIRHPVSVVDAFPGVPGTFSVADCWAAGPDAATMTRRAVSCMLRV